MGLISDTAYRFYRPNFNGTNNYYLPYKSNLMVNAVLDAAQV
jgi:hypothetical protein